MPHRSKIFRLKGAVQNYAWGGYDYIATLLGATNEGRQPMAEYWMGAHTSAPALLETADKKQIAITDYIKKNPVQALGEEVARKFGDLPYLYKILDVKDMLSIQVHPTREEARKGFDAEEQAGIPLGAAHRNYKDRNHKPEVMIALSEFWLLHGFKTEPLLQQTLEAVPEFASLLPVFAEKGYKGLYGYVMEMPQEAADALLLPLVQREIAACAAGQCKKEEPGWWVNKLYNGEAPAGNIDKGVFSIYFFNIVKVKPGEAVFQAAGVPHAYLEGQNVELMANSDNVLRGGLTPKHVDVPELMKHTLFEGIEPRVLRGEVLSFGEIHYPCQTEDFCISKISLTPTGRLQAKSKSFEIMIVMEGSVRIHGANTHEMDFKKGEVIAIAANEVYALTANGFEAVLYKAYVPLA